jgi:hypothetical protein
MLHNPKKDEGGYDTPEEEQRHIEEELREFIDDHARDIVRGHRGSDFFNLLRWFRRKRNRADTARRFREDSRQIKWIAPLLRGHPQVPDGAIELMARQLEWVAEWLEKNKSPKGGNPKYDIKEAVDALQEYYKDNLGKPDWKTIGKIILEEFPDAQGAKRLKGDLFDWVRQIAGRR